MTIVRGRSDSVEIARLEVSTSDEVALLPNYDTTCPLPFIARNYDLGRLTSKRKHMQMRHGMNLCHIMPNRMTYLLLSSAALDRC